MDTPKLCPVCRLPNEEWRVICKTTGCVHVFAADNPQPGVATIRRTYPVHEYEPR
jgi:hypothetical protein